MHRFIVALLGLCLLTCHPGMPAVDPYDVSNRAIVPYIQQAIEAYGKMCGEYCGKVTIIPVNGGDGFFAATDMLFAGYSEIYYDPKNLEMLARAYGPVVIFAIIQHELGHHRDMMSRVFGGQIGDEWFVNSWVREVTADYWSGCLLTLTNYSVATYTEAMRALAPRPSPTHPDYQLRNKAILQGYSECSQL